MCAFFSECGDEFDEYARHIVGGMGANQRSVSNLWAGRRFKLHYNGEWKEGRVVEWFQWKVDPERHLTNWNVKLTMVSDRQDERENMQNMDVSSSVKECSFLTLRVNRMNIKGGGTLQLETPDSPLFSLEWLDPASPPVNLEQGVLAYKCPYCRTAEPILAAHEQADITTAAECPICLETTDCRILGCGHGVCHSCWRSYMQAATNMSMGIDFGHSNEDEIQAERARRREIFKTKLSSGTNHFAKLVDEVFSGEQNLAAFWKELMVESVLMFFHSDVKVVINKLSTEAVKIFLQVLDVRKEELFAMLNGMHDEELREFVSSISFYCCDVIAENYRQAGRTRCALPWSQLALFHAKQARSRTLLAAAHVFLGSAQQSAGMLIEASRTFDGSLGLGSSAGDVWKYREDLLREIEQWTGSSGKLTPGC